MNVTSAYSHSNIAFRCNRSDQNHHGQTAQAPHLSESPAVTLSRVIQDGRSQLLATTPVSFSPLSAVQLALSNQILLFENVTFQGGKNTFGPPITLSRLEKHQAIQKAKRDKALTVNYSSSIPLDPEQVAFLNTPLAHREEQPLTGFDLLKLIDEATQKDGLSPTGRRCLL